MADDPEQTTTPTDKEDPLRAALRLHQAEQPADAIPLYEQAIANHPGTAQLHCLLGVALKQTGDLTAGIQQLEKAVALDSTRPDLNAELGIAYMQAGAAEKAAAALGDAVPKLAVLGQDDALVLIAYGDACFALNRWTEAVTHYRAALAKAPDNLDVQLNVGVALHHLDRKSEAIEAYEAVLATKPDHAAALTNLGVAYQEMKRFDASLGVLQRAAELSPRDALILTDLGTTLERLGRLEEAIQHYTQALSEDPTYAKAWSNLGNAYQASLDLTAAWEAHQRAVKLEPDNPDLHWNLAMTLLLAGEFEQGWAEYEWRRKKGNDAFDPAVPEWQGEALTRKTILLSVEQGAGDAIQFARYAALLAVDSARVLVRAHTSLQRLFGTLDGNVKI
ncbi:MAG TPA: hypothetical protein DCE33_00645, partial [Rhodospirillaceae bacterium]|nr:hypothetical protein [Rhodospirillaceae bacterium]